MKEEELKEEEEERKGRRGERYHFSGPETAQAT